MANLEPRKINPVLSHIARLKGVSEETGSSEDKFKNSGSVVPKVLDSNLIMVSMLEFSGK